ncbi:MAG: DUF58 domain-containing protein [Nostocaceae cyanobacterium]|nr:DUF58 domain-containing protein [Nostocaceae cyanobacterium]
MKIIKGITNWLENHAAVPAYSGWVLAGITICFFGAAMNSMAGWLYVISGVSCAVLAIAAILPPQSLRGLRVTRLPIQPVTAGDELKVELEIRNQSKQPAALIQVVDVLPFVLGTSLKQAIEKILPKDNYRWVYYYPTQRRGIYRWHNVEVKSGAPLGLFWCTRQRECQASAIVYPTVLSLTSCPLIDQIGQKDSLRSDPGGTPLHTATEGLTRSLRPYRTGDPMRLIHWRSSARYGELRVRELEIITGGQEIVIALDSAGNWETENFEQAVIAAASLYFYARRQQMQVQLWTAYTGLLKGDRSVLEALAATNSGEDSNAPQPPSYQMIWLTQNPLTLSSLPNGSRWLLWQDSSSAAKVIINREYPGMIVQVDTPLQSQLQKSASYN